MSDKKVPYVVNYNNPVYQIFSDSLMMQFDGKEVIGLYNFQEDRLLQHNILSRINEPAPQEMLRYLQATIQQYVTRIKENRLTIEKDGSKSR
jgi:hypothetical protein